MQELNFKAGTVVNLDNTLYRILDVNTKQILLIAMDIEKFDFQRIQTDCMMHMIETGKLVEAEYEEKQYCIETLTEAEMLLLGNRQSIIENMLTQMYPNWDELQHRKAKPEFYDVCKQLGIKKKAGLRLLRRYLQSGRNIYSLLDGRKQKAKGELGKNVRGAKNKNGNSSNVQNDAILQEHYHEFFMEFMETKEKGGTIQYSYDHMLQKYYTIREVKDGELIVRVVPKEDRPSYKRYLRYCNEQLGNLTIRQAKKGRRAVRNDERLLLGNARSGCDYPGQILEVDELEVDMYNVSEADSRQLVGRAIVYMAVDVYSSCIVACWADYHNNSYMGVSNLFFTLMEEHNRQTEKYGVTIPSEVYPSCFLPSEIRVDHGSEYISKEFRRAMGELGITVTLVSPGSGSLKGLVEQSFHQFQEMLRGEAQGTGIILKRVESAHYETACTDIHDVRSMVYQFVAYANMHAREGYPFTKEMVEQNIIPAPCGIWKYGQENFGKPRTITEALKPQVMFALLKTDRVFKVSRAGIEYKGLYYYTRYPWLIEAMTKAEKKKVKMEGIRYDQRSVQKVYVMMDGIVYAVELNTDRGELRGFSDLTWTEYDEMYEKKLEMLRKYEEEDTTARLAAREAIGNTIQTARKFQGEGQNSKKNMRQALHAERNRIASNAEMESGYREVAVDVVQKKESIVLPAKADDFSDLDDFFEA